MFKCATCYQNSCPSFRFFFFLLLLCHSTNLFNKSKLKMHMALLYWNHKLNKSKKCFNILIAYKNFKKWKVTFIHNKQTPSPHLWQDGGDKTLIPCNSNTQSSLLRPIISLYVSDIIAIFVFSFHFYLQAFFRPTHKKCHPLITHTLN